MPTRINRFISISLICLIGLSPIQGALAMSVMQTADAEQLSTMPNQPSATEHCKQHDNEPMEMGNCCPGTHCSSSTQALFQGHLFSFIPTHTQLSAMPEQSPDATIPAGLYRPPQA